MNIKKLVITGLVGISLLSGCGIKQANNEDTVFKNHKNGTFTLLMKTAKINEGKYKGKTFLSDGQATFIVTDLNLKENQNYEVKTESEDGNDIILSYKPSKAKHTFNMDKRYMNEEKDFYLNHLNKKGSN